MFSDSECDSFFVKSVVFVVDKVVVVSYNILGVENASKHPDLYFKVPKRFMAWDRRKALIREEIDRYDASIVCLQVCIAVTHVEFSCKKTFVF